jgi:ectoine hydroxylase-related dioxygenase (phytanoyl-CoA dioxygenase family)
MSTAAPALATSQNGLTDAQIAEFHERGFFIKRGMYPRELIDRLRIEIDNLHEREHRKPTPGVWTSWEQDLPDGRPPRIRQLMNSEVVSPILDAMSRSDEMLSVMRQLIGPDLYLYHAKLMMKAAHDGTFTPWHQDWGYWQYDLKEPTQVNCMLHIDAADEANGSLRFVVGSHRNGPVPHDRFPSDSFSIGLTGGIDAYPGEVIIMEPGDAVFFGSLIIHGSAPNTSSRDRRANTFAFDKAFNKQKDVMPDHMHRAGRKG